MSKRRREEGANGGDPPKKPKCYDEGKSLNKLRSLLDKEDTLSAGLVYLWKEIKEHDNASLRRSYLSAHPDCSHILLLLELSTKLHDQDNVLLCLLLLEDVLLYTAEDSTSKDLHPSIGTRLVTSLLDSHTPSLNYSLSNNKPDVLAAAAIRLLTAAVMQGRSSAIEVLNKFDFSSSNLDRLPRHHKRYEEGCDSVRICFIKLAVSFLVVGNSFIINQAIILNKFIPTLFRGLKKDPRDIRQLFLSTVYEKVVQDSGITKKSKICIFNSYNLKFLVELLHNSDYQDETSKDIVYNLLLSLSSDFKYGVCFKSVKIFLDNKKTNNPLLLHLAFKLMSYLGQSYASKLITSMISTCLDIFIPFLSGASLDLDPKPTQKWVWHMELLISLLLDCSQIKHFVCEEDDTANSGISKYIKSYIECCCPMILSRTVLSNGIQSSCLVIKDVCLKGLLAVLKRTDAFQSHLNGKTREVLCDSVLRGLPDIKTVMNLRHFVIQLSAGKSFVSSDTIPADQLDILARNEEIALSSSELFNNVTLALYLYQRLVPTLLAQASINITKLFTESINTCNKFGVSPNCVQTTLDMLLEAPVGSLQGVLKGECIECLLNLIVVEDYQEKVIQIFIKCLQVYPCLLDYNYQLSIIFNVLTSHLLSPLNSEKEKSSLRSIIAEAITELSKKSFRWFNVFITHEEEECSRDSENVNFQQELLCPLLGVFLDQCSRTPTISCVLMVSELILKLVHTSVDPVAAASCVLCKLQRDGKSFLVSDKLESCSEKCVHLLKTHLEVWSNKTSEDIALDAPLAMDCEVYENTNRNSEEVREYLLSLFCRPLTCDVMVELLSNKLLHRPCLSLLEALPISLDGGSFKKLKGYLPFYLCWWQVFNFQNVPNLRKAISCVNGSKVQKVLRGLLSEEIDSISSYRLGVVCREILSVYSCSLIHFKDDLSVQSARLFCLELLAVALSRCSPEQIDFHLSLIYDLVLPGNLTGILEPSFISRFVPLCISLRHPSFDELLYKILLTATTVSEGHQLEPSTSSKISAQLFEKSNANSYLKHNKVIFQHLLKSDIADSRYDVISLLEYCSKCISAPNLLMLVMESVPMNVSISYAVEYLNNVAAGLHKCSSIVLEFVRYVLRKWKSENLHIQVDQEYLQSFVTHSTDFLKDLLLSDDTDEKPTDLCKEIIEVLITLYPSIKRSFKKILSKILAKSQRNCLSEFEVEMIGSLSCAAVPNYKELWLSSVECLLSELHDLLKGKNSKDDNKRSLELILIEALHKALKCTSSEDMSLELIAYSDFVKVFDKFMLKAISKRINCPLMMSLLSELVTFVYSNGPVKVTTVTPESIYAKVWSKANCEITAAHVQLLATVAKWITDASVFKSDHIASLLGNYSATLSHKDTCILVLLSLYEKSGVSLAQFSPLVWGDKAFEMYKPRMDKSWLLWKQPTAQEVLLLMDSKTLKLSIDGFPYDRPLEPTVTVNTDSTTIYDPCFIIPLISSLLQPTSAVDCCSFVKGGYLSYVITATSSLCEDMRKSAFHFLHLFNEHLVAADKFNEKHQLSLLMDILHNTLAKDNVRLPTVVSSLFSKAALLFTHTEEDLFPVISDFVISKPFVDFRDIPLYDTLLQSPRVEERLWELQLLSDGLKSEGDYHVYGKNGIISHLMSLYQSPLMDNKSKLLIMEFLIKACTNKRAAHDLTWNYNFLSWIHNLNQIDPSLLEMVCNTYRTVTAGNEDNDRLRNALYLEEDVAITMNHFHQLL